MLHCDRDFDLIASVTGQPAEAHRELNVRAGVIAWNSGLCSHAMLSLPLVNQRSLFDTHLPCGGPSPQ